MPGAAHLDIFPKRPVELVSIANDNCLFPRLFIQNTLDLMFSIAGENVRTQIDPRDAFARRRTRRIYIDPNGEMTRAGNPHIQKARLGFIDEDGKSHRWKSDFSEKMYLRLLNTKTGDRLEHFIEATGFCIFPTVAETRALFTQYEEKGIKAPRIFSPRRETDTKRNSDHMGIFFVNKEFIAKKRDKLRALVTHYQKGTLQYDQLLWLNQQMENVSSILIDGKHFIWDEIKKGAEGERADDARTLGEIVGLQEIRNMKIIPALRVYGHFAYCCYEFFIDILEKNQVLICKKCERYFHPNRKGQFLCKEPSCVQSRNSNSKLKKKAL